MLVHYDPAYRRSILRNYSDFDKAPLVMLEDISLEALRPLAASLRERFEIIFQA